MSDIVKRRVVIKTTKKGQTGSTGKKAVIIEIDEDGAETEVFSARAGTGRALSRLLRGTGKIPPRVVLNKYGVTEFEV